MSDNTSIRKPRSIEKKMHLDYVHSIIKKNDVMGNRGFELIELAGLYIRQGQQDKALNTLSEALDVAKRIKSDKSESDKRLFRELEATDILIKATEVYYQIGRSKQVYKILQKAINDTFISVQKYQLATEYLFEIARLLYGNGEKDRALDILNDVSRKIITRCFLSKDRRHLHALLSAEAKRDAKTSNIQLFGKLVSSYGRICQRLIETFCDMGLPDTAIVHLDKLSWNIISFGCTKSFLEYRYDALACVVGAYAEIGCMGKAYKLIEKEKPDLAKSSYNWSIAYAKCNDWKNAFRATEKLGEIALFNGVYLDIAELAIMKNNKTIAKKALDLALQCAEKHETPYFTLSTLNRAAKVTLLMGDSKKNALICNKALRYAVEHLWDTIYDDNLAELVGNCVKTGKEQEALKLLRKALKRMAKQIDASQKSASVLSIARAYLDNCIEMGEAEIKLLKKIDG